MPFRRRAAASMRPRQSSLGIRLLSRFRSWSKTSFNEAEAIKPRNLSRSADLTRSLEKLQ